MTTKKPRKSTAKKTTARTTKRKSTASASRKTTARKKASPKKSTAKPAVAPWLDVANKLDTSADILPIKLPWGMGGIASQIGAVKVGNMWYTNQTNNPVAVMYAAPQYSWASYIAKKARGLEVKKAPQPTNDFGSYTLRPDQVIDVDKVVDSFDSGSPEFLIASLTGVGKTVVAVASALRLRGLRRVLVLCPEPVQAVWRQHLADMGDGGMDWVIINYESNKNLLKPDSRALNAKTTSTKNKNLALHGTPWENFDLVITDESHMTGNPTSQQTRVTEKMIDSGAKSLRMTATPGKDPSKIHYLRRGLAYATESPVFSVENSFDEYVRWAKTQGIKSIVPAPFGNGIAWDGPQSELDTINTIIFNPSSGKNWALRSEPSGWPEQMRSAIPITLTAEERSLYESEWSEFSKVMSGLQSAKNLSRSEAKTKGLAAQVRYRQKVGQLKVPYIIKYAEMLLSGGNQVMISAIYKDTVAALQEGFEKKGVEVALFTGSNTSTREQERIAFQRGEKKVIIFSTTVGISLHAGEEASGANDAERAHIVAEPRWSAIEADQTEGRGTRNAQHAHSYYPYAVDTNDEKVTRTMVRGLATMHTMVGSDVDLIEDLADAMGFALFGDD